MVVVANPPSVPPFVGSFASTGPRPVLPIPGSAGGWYKWPAGPPRRDLPFVKKAGPTAALIHAFPVPDIDSDLPALGGHSPGDIEPVSC